MAWVANMVDDMAVAGTDTAAHRAARMGTACVAGMAADYGAGADDAVADRASGTPGCLVDLDQDGAGGAVFAAMNR